MITSIVVNDLFTVTVNIDTVSMPISRVVVLWGLELRRQLHSCSELRHCICFVATTVLSFESCGCCCDDSLSHLNCNRGLL